MICLSQTTFLNFPRVFGIKVRQPLLLEAIVEHPFLLDVCSLLVYALLSISYCNVCQLEGV